ncbi:Crinkler effector protein 8 [Phytophthora oleae]|uniref:Crinkler effector protein 8 n=1 Tax=Phytophthora oleae TaxID=2107226 RepID=A0ABD3FAE1_9STRA
MIGDGSGFVVNIDEIKKVGHLKNIIKERKMYHFPADQLTLYFAKKDGECSSRTTLMSSSWRMEKLLAEW